MSIQKQIFDYCFGERNLVILQGARGSGKSLFAAEFKGYFDRIGDDSSAPKFKICSIDDYYGSVGQDSRDISGAFASCETVMQDYMKQGFSVIYNGENWCNDRVDCIAEFARELRFNVIIFRFFSFWDEDKNVEIAKQFHSSTQRNITKSMIINDNILLFGFRDNHKMIGIQANFVENSLIDQYIVFTECSASLANKKREYTQKRYYGYISDQKLYAALNDIHQENELATLMSNLTISDDIANSYTAKNNARRRDRDS